MTHSDTLGSSQEIADFLGITPNKLAKMRMDGDGPAFIRVNARTIRYRWNAVNEWLESRTHTTTDEYAA